MDNVYLLYLQIPLLADCMSFHGHNINLMPLHFVAQWKYDISVFIKQAYSLADNLVAINLVPLCPFLNLPHEHNVKYNRISWHSKKTLCMWI